MKGFNSTCCSALNNLCIAAFAASLRQQENTLPYWNIKIGLNWVCCYALSSFSEQKLAIVVVSGKLNTNILLLIILKTQLPFYS